MKKSDFIKKLSEALPEDFNLSQKDLNEVFDNDYYLSFLDLLILINNYKLPVAIISRLTLPSFNRLKTGLTLFLGFSVREQWKFAMYWLLHPCIMEFNQY